MYLDSPVRFEYAARLNEVLWLLYRFLNSVEERPMYSFESFSVLTIALYTSDSVMHFPCKGQFSIPSLQRPSTKDVLVPRILLLWLEIMLEMFGIQLYDTLTLLRLKYLCSGELFWKCLFIKQRNARPTLVFTAILNGGLNHKMFRFLQFRC